MSEYTLLVCLGGTGTQIGTALGNLYPLLQTSHLADDGCIYKMFIMDKDTRGKNYEYCGIDYIPKRCRLRVCRRMK